MPRNWPRAYQVCNLEWHGRWREVSQAGSHKQFKHPAKKGRVAVPHPIAMDYIAFLHKDRDSDFGVSFPDFPGCVTAGKTLEEARRMAAEALALHIAGMVEYGDEIPAPSSLEALAKNPAMKGAVAFLVPVEPKAERTVGINITAREKQVPEIDRLAKRAGVTRSAYLVQSALQRAPARGRTAEGKGPGTGQKDAAPASRVRGKDGYTSNPALARDHAPGLGRASRRFLPSGVGLVPFYLPVSHNRRSQSGARPYSKT